MSRLGPDGAADYLPNLRALKSGTPILWVGGDRDWVPTANDRSLYDAAPGNPKSKFVTISVNHLNTPADARSVVADWLAALRRGPGGT